MHEGGSTKDVELVVEVTVAFRFREGDAEDLVGALGGVGGNLDEALAPRGGKDEEDSGAEEEEEEGAECAGEILVREWEVCCLRFAGRRSGGAMERFFEILVRRNRGPEEEHRPFRLVELSLSSFF